MKRLLALLILLLPAPLMAQGAPASRVPSLWDGFFLKAPTTGLPTCTAGLAGLARYDTTTSTMKFCNGTSWGTFGNTGTIDGTLVATRVPFASDADTLTDDADLTFATDTLSATKVNVKAGAGTTALSVDGVLCKANPTGADATTETTNEEIVGAVCSLTANSIAIGATLRVQLSGVTAANANTKAFRVRLGAAGSCLTGAVMYSSGNVTWNNLVFFSEGVEIHRISASAATTYGIWHAYPKGGSGSQTAAPSYMDDTEAVDWTVALDVCITFDTDTAAAGATLNSYNVRVLQ